MSQNRNLCQEQVTPLDLRCHLAFLAGKINFVMLKIEFVINAKVCNLEFFFNSRPKFLDISIILEDLVVDFFINRVT